MRKIAANYVFPIAGAPIRNGYVKFNDNNEVVEVGQLAGECEDTEFYSGILCPDLQMHTTTWNSPILRGRLSRQQE